METGWELPWKLLFAPDRFRQLFGGAVESTLLSHEWLGNSDFSYFDAAELIQLH